MKTFFPIFTVVLLASVGTAQVPKVSKAAKRLRVIMTSDFPPIGVVKGGNVPNTMKSDPDDMQSMVRFLLYANEFDIEILVASGGTFAMEAHKKNILGVIDQYEKVYETFLYLVSANRGINDPEDPTQPSWGGQYKRKGSTNHYVDGPGGSSISKWREDSQREFQERADWCVK